MPCVRCQVRRRPSLSHGNQVFTSETVDNRKRHARDVRTLLEVLLEISNGAVAGVGALIESPDEVQSSLLALALLAVDVAEAASPFAVDADSQSAAFALATMANALRILALANAVPREEERRPLPQLLPHVHTLWPSFVSALMRGQPAAARMALEVIPSVAALSGGDFVRDRVRSDLWPSLRVMLSPANENARMRQASLKCLADLAAADSTRSALSGVLHEATDSLIGVLQQPQASSALQAMAISTLQSLSRLDSDAVFFLECRAGRRSLGFPPGADTALFAPLDIILV